MRRSSTGILALQIMTLVLADRASATLVDLGNVTRDTTSGLDWLDVTETQGLSWNEVVAGPLYAAGWVHATVPQWCDFVGGLGATSGWVIFAGPGGPVSSHCGANPPAGTSNGAFVNFEDDAFGVDWPLLQSNFGITQDSSRTIGVLNYGPNGDPLNRSVPYVPRATLHDLHLMPNLDDGFQLSTQLFGIPATTQGDSTGHFLLRPIPADTDNDGIADDIDNCPDDPNPGQEDADLDLIGDLCDPFPTDPDNEQAQCEVDLDQALADLAACEAEPVFVDADSDGEHDPTDACPGTPLATPVDGDGCSLLQFCTSIATPTKTDERACKKSDWQNDEPLGNAEDCEVEKLSGLCVPR